MTFVTPVAAERLHDALKGGKAAVDFRYRYEFVDDKAFSKNSYASTLRTVVGYRSAPWNRLSLMLEAENIAVIGDDDYNSGRNGQSDRPLVPDPKGTEMNQAFLEYNWEGAKTTAWLGRREINRGDQRFVGTVAWRQNHQSYDGIEAKISALPRTTVNYAFIKNVNTVIGANLSMYGHLLDAPIGITGKATLMPYAYFLHFRDDMVAGLSTYTLGTELKGEFDPGDDLQVVYELEYAHQSDFENNPNNVAIGYANAIVGVKWKVEVTAGYELLGGKPDKGRFTTQLATLHKFNGWADKFVATPANGLQDYYLDVGDKIHGVTWKIVAHAFNADSGGANYGRELDFLVLWKASWDQVFALKGAFYDAKSYSSSATRVWVWTSYAF